MESTANGKAAGSGPANDAAAIARPPPPRPTPREIGLVTPRAARMGGPKFAPKTPMRQQCTVVRAVDAPIILACTMASAAVARGMSALPRSSGTMSVRTSAAIIRMPTNDDENAPATIAIEFSCRSFLRAKRPKANEMIAGSRKNMIKLPAALFHCPPATRYSPNRAMRPLPRKAPCAIKRAVHKKYVGINGCRNFATCGERKRGNLEEKTKANTEALAK
mmetsp:Transcript_90700/g.146763  ORF Transcript_90700/g.146763 Transcript_90700/m.146763 type:complete len:220 (+) Transcript_90700:419-1078(+)